MRSGKHDSSTAFSHLYDMKELFESNAIPTKPILLISTWRGEPNTKDEPQHKLIGEKIRKILDLINVKNDVFPKNKLSLQKKLLRIDRLEKICLQ